MFADNRIDYFEQQKLHYLGITKSDLQRIDGVFKKTKGELAPIPESQTLTQARRPVLFLAEHPDGRRIVADASSEFNKDYGRSLRVLEKKRNGRWRNVPLKSGMTSAGGRGGVFEFKDGTSLVFEPRSWGTIATTRDKAGKPKTELTLLDPTKHKKELKSISQPRAPHTPAKPLDAALANRLAKAMKSKLKLPGQIAQVLYEGMPWEGQGYVRGVSFEMPPTGAPEKKGYSATIEQGTEKSSVKKSVPMPPAGSQPQYTAYVSYRNSHHFPYEVRLYGHGKAEGSVRGVSPKGSVIDGNNKIIR